MDNRDMFRRMRRSPDPEQRAIGEAERSIWIGIEEDFGSIVDWMVEAADTPELKEQALALKRELEDRSSV